MSDAHGDGFGEEPSDESAGSTERGAGPAEGADTEDAVAVRVRHEDEETTLRVTPGVTLRDALVAADRERADLDLSPYTSLTGVANCGGRGLCATCGVRVLEGPAPDHWHDRVAARYGYPRLSCQIRVDEPMTVALVTDKRIWGAREPRPSSNAERESSSEDPAE